MGPLVFKTRGARATIRDSLVSNLFASSFMTVPDSRSFCLQTGYLNGALTLSCAVASCRGLRFLTFHQAQIKSILIGRIKNLRVVPTVCLIDFGPVEGRLIGCAKYGWSASESPKLSLSVVDNDRSAEWRSLRLSPSARSRIETNDPESIIVALDCYHRIAGLVGCKRRAPIVVARGRDEFAAGTAASMASIVTAPEV